MAPRRKHRVPWLVVAALAALASAWLAQPAAPLRLQLAPDGAHELVLVGPLQNRLGLRVSWHLAPAWQALLSAWLEIDVGKGNRT